MRSLLVSVGQQTDPRTLAPRTGGRRTATTFSGQCARYSPSLAYVITGLCLPAATSQPPPPTLLLYLITISTLSPVFSSPAISLAPCNHCRLRLQQQQRAYTSPRPGRPPLARNPIAQLNHWTGSEGTQLGGEWKRQLRFIGAHHFRVVSRRACPPGILFEKPDVHKQAILPVSTHQTCFNAPLVKDLGSVCVHPLGWTRLCLRLSGGASLVRA